MKTTITTIIILCTISTVVSQDDREPLLTSPTRFTFKFGFADIDLDAMNLALGEYGYAII